MLRHFAYRRRYRRSTTDEQLLNPEESKVKSSAKKSRSAKEEKESAKARKELLKKEDKILSSPDASEEEKAKVKGSEKRLSVLKDIIKQYALQNMRPGDRAVKIGGWKLDTVSRKEIDKEAMKRDGILDQYIRTKDEYRLTYKEDK